VVVLNLFNIWFSNHSLGNRGQFPRNAHLLPPPLWLASYITQLALYSCAPSYLTLASLPEVVAAQNDSHDVLANIMYISFHSC